MCRFFIVDQVSFMYARRFTVDHLANSLLDFRETSKCGLISRLALLRFLALLTNWMLYPASFLLEIPKTGLEGSGTGTWCSVVADQI